MATIHTKHHQTTSLADALFSGTRQKVLGILFLRPNQDFTIGELINEAGAGSGAVQREVTRLLESGLLLVTLRGRQKRYQANPDAPIFQEISSITRKILGPSKRIENALHEIDDRIELALIYGSVASNNDHAGSDIDLMLVSDELMLEDVFAALEAVERDLSRPINPTLYTSREFEQRRAQGNSFIRKVLGGKFILLKGSVDEQRSIGKSGKNKKTTP